MKVDGYMVEAEWDGETLTARGTNKVGSSALGAHDGLSLPRDQIERVTLKPATPMTNGNLTIRARGSEHVLHFRRKDQDAFQALADELDAERSTTNAGMRQKISEAGGAGGCPKCGGQQFRAKRSKKGKMTGGLLAPKTQVKCVACGTMYRRG